MSIIAIVYWSGTGNTQSMAEAVKAGAEQSHNIHTTQEDSHHFWLSSFSGYLLLTRLYYAIIALAIANY